MEKAIVFSDLHIHLYKAFNEGNRRLKNGIAFLDYIFTLAHTNGIKYLLMPGDLANNMQIISTKVVNAITTCLNNNFEQYPEIILIAVSGNHDQATVNLIDTPAESILEYLAEVFPNFILLDYSDVSEYITEGKNRISGISYFEHQEHFQAALTIVSNRTDPNRGNVTLLMHQTVGSGLPIEDTIEPDDPLFNNFSLVLNGHIHTCEQLTDKFINVGNPQARDAGDIGKKKGFWIVDLDDPQATISFKDISDKYPQFLYKTVGEPLTDWEKEQYVIFQPAVTAENTSDNLRNEKFSNTLQPTEILENYCNETLPKEEIKDKLAYGIKLLQS